MVDRSHADSPEPILPELEFLIRRRAGEPAPVLPELEALVRRRTAKLTRARAPRRRAVVSTATAAVATCVATAFLLVLPSGHSFASPQETVAAAAKSLDGNGVLHWVRRTDYRRAPTTGASRPTPPTTVEDEWTDLATGDSHRTVNEVARKAGLSSAVDKRWVERGISWFSIPAPSGRPELVLMRIPDSRPRRKSWSVVDQVRSALARAQRGTAEVTEARSEDGAPLVVIADQQVGRKVRLWITREENPRIIRWTTTLTDPAAGRSVDSAVTTKVWEVLPRTRAALENSRIPSSAVRRG